MSPRRRSIDATEGIENAHLIPDPETRRKLYAVAIESAEAFQAGEITAREVVNRLKKLREEARAGVKPIESAEAFGVPEVVNIGVEAETLETFLRAVERGEISADDALAVLKRTATEVHR